MESMRGTDVLSRKGKKESKTDAKESTMRRRVDKRTGGWTSKKEQG